MMSNDILVRWAQKHGDKVQTLVPVDVREQFTAERVAMWAAETMAKQPQLRKCNPSNLLDAFKKIMRLGLDPTGVTSEAYLVPYGQQCNVIIGQQGYIRLAYQSGVVEHISTQAVYENDLFEFNLATGDVSHSFDVLNPEGRGQLVAGYCRVKMTTSPNWHLEVMGIQEFLRIERDQRGSNSKASPYQKYKGEMLRRTILKRALKRVPMSPLLTQARDLEHQGYDNLRRAPGPNPHLEHNGDRVIAIAADEVPNEVPESIEHPEPIEATTEEGA